MVGKLQLIEALGGTSKIRNLRRKRKWDRIAVGGYAGAVKAGQSVIFHIEAAGEPSTTEISKHSTNGTAPRFFIEQHRGVWNKEPSRFHKNRARDLVNYLNMRHC